MADPEVGTAKIISGGGMCHIDPAGDGPVVCFGAKNQTNRCRETDCASVLPLSGRSLGGRP